MATKKPKKISPKTRFLSRFFLSLGTAGVACILIGNSYLAYERFKYSFVGALSPTIHQSRSYNYPEQIEIPSAGISLPVVERAIIHGVWNVSPDTATHLTQSAFPGEPGNTVIYGHNLTRIFGKLTDVNVGDSVKIITQDGITHQYRVTYKQIVSPTRIDLVSPSTTEILTIYTCAGWFDSQRLVLQAEPVMNKLNL